MMYRRWESNPHSPKGTGFLSPLRSETKDDTEGQAATKVRFYRGLGASQRTGRDGDRHPVALRCAVKARGWLGKMEQRRGYRSTLQGKQETQDPRWSQVEALQKVLAGERLFA
jgi:hypothetical protein